MNSVLIATDFSAVNDDVKFLEMNTVKMGTCDLKKWNKVEILS